MLLSAGSSQSAENIQWEIFSPESNLFCGSGSFRIGAPKWNTLDFHDSLEGCAEACINMEECKFATWRTDTGLGQCNGFTNCDLNENEPNKRFIVIKLLQANPTMKPTAVPTFQPTFEPSSSPIFEPFELTAAPTFEPSSSPTLIPSEPTSAPVKSMVKDAFDQVKLSETRFALPGLIRKAFHDAGHFDQQSGEMRMGCIQHFLSGDNKCPQHNNLHEAESFVDAVIEKVPSLSMADAVQLLGALAVDELAQGTNAPLLYDRVRTGRTDPHESDCLQDRQEMCNNLPAFSTRRHTINDHDDIVESLNDVWEKEISGKMMAENTLSKQDAVALIGAHTVGRHFGFGAWVEQPMIFDNEYFLQLKKIKDWLDSGSELGTGQGHPFGFGVHGDWFQDSARVADPEAPFSGALLMMLDSDIALVVNAPELVEEYASDMMKWRSDFDDAYVIMGELGVTDALEPPTADTAESGRRLLRRAQKQLDEDFEFFQNLQILHEEQTENLAEIHAAGKQMKL